MGAQNNSSTGFWIFLFFLLGLETRSDRNFTFSRLLTSMLFYAREFFVPHVPIHQLPDQMGVKLYLATLETKYSISMLNFIVICFLPYPRFHNSLLRVKLTPKCVVQRPWKPIPRNFSYFPGPKSSNWGHMGVKNEFSDPKILVFYIYTAFYIIFPLSPVSQFSVKGETNAKIDLSWL